MEDILERIDQDLKEALLKRDELSVSVLRMLKAALVNKEKEKRLQLSKEGKFLPESIKEKEILTEQEVLGVILSEIKKRKESIKFFKEGERKDLYEKEEKELAILEKYLPPQLSSEEIEEIVKKVIREVGAKNVKDMGRVMKEVMPKLKGRAEGKLVSEIVKRLLSA